MAVVLLTAVLPETFAADVRAVGSKLQLFLDDWLIQSLENVRPILHSPDRREAAIRKDQPWEDIYLYNPVVIKDGHRYRMWYRAKYVELLHGLRREPGRYPLGQAQARVDRV